MKKSKKNFKRSVAGVFLIGIFTFIILMGLSSLSYATPSTQINIPSTDNKDFGLFHIDVDNYFTVGRSSGKSAAYQTDAGLSVGVLPFEKIKLETGIDLIGGNNGVSDHVFYNAKLSAVEDGFFKHQPAVAIGIYNADFKQGKPQNFDIGYILASKTFPVIGRLSAGYYQGNQHLLKSVSDMVKNQNQGYLLSWDRTISEISDKLWIGVDYFSGKSSFGALGAGISWQFAPNVSVIFGMSRLNEPAIGAPRTFATIQLDINFDFFTKKK